MMEITNTYTLKFHNERTMWSVYDGIHKHIQIERSQWENHVISVLQNSWAHTDWKITKRESCDQCITGFTSKDRLKDHKERIIWLMYNRVPKQRQSERSQWKDHLINVWRKSWAHTDWKITMKNHVISVWRNSQSNTDWKITMREPCDQCIMEFTSTYRLKDHKERIM